MTENEKAIHVLMYDPDCLGCFGVRSNWSGDKMRAFTDNHPSLPGEYIGFTFDSSSFTCDYCKRVKPIVFAMLDIHQDKP